METKPEFSSQKRLAALLRSKNASWSRFLGLLFIRPAYWIIILSNMAIFFLPGLDLKHNASTFLYIYLIQSLLIGLTHVIKLNFYKFAPASRATDWKSPHAISLFFIVHFGFFHLVYMFFIPPKDLNWQTILFGSAINALVIVLNSIRHFRTENDGHYNANDFMFLPYLRIIPIHIAIILGGFIGEIAGNYAVVFILLAIIKTGMELILEYFQSLGISFKQMEQINLSSHE